MNNQLIALQNALDVSGVGFWQLDANDQIHCDAHSKRLLGLKPSDSLNDLTEFLMRIQESQHAAFLDALDLARTDNQPIEFHLHLDKPASQRVTGFKLSARLCRLPGQTDTYLSGLLQPLPESSLEVEKRSESALAEVRSANAELANFASIASHDMREPLRMITSYLRLLQERSPKALDDRARRYISYACEGADRMRSLIEDLLSYARLDKSDKAFEPLDLEDIMAHAIDNLRANIRETRAEITIAVDTAPVVMGDSVRLTRLFQNLLANAIKFNRPQATPHVNVTFKDGSKNEASGQCIVSIKDQGIGIDPDYHDVLFDLFRRLHTRDEYDGSGIGLAISKKIAEQHGGRIWFQSHPGHGSTFYVALDKADAQSLA
ncbi:ATP-binding protein [Coraliomargarita sp. SDUM461004]|uniref:histidine kinase n=1 Tax=Thalassobacterium sedimentorum TaxID=3041258 RepID=A0ABU1AJ80_9BACT|nr:ATP-binding protein [Coraliomargarita sp. SDUM461004]MDQ8194874.1 ATP-binding protein [Coraliomargarita sp. SDUM461004]